MPEEDRLARWRAALGHLCRGPAPRGEVFDLCRRVLDGAPGGGEREQAARTLLEGAMADADTDIAVAQDVMHLLRSLDRGELTVADLLPRR